jgi:hypothetical protein
MNKIRVQEIEQTVIPCPCGCGKRAEQFDGTLHLELAEAQYRLILMRAPDGEPLAWLSVSSRVQTSDPRHIRVTLQATRHGARIEDATASPLTGSTFGTGQALARREVLEIAGAAELHLACFDALLTQHSRALEFLLE